MLYGRQRPEGKATPVCWALFDVAHLPFIIIVHFNLSQVHFDPLSCAEFRDLLLLVTVCSMESLDPRLAPLRKQTKKWYRKLLK